MADDRSLADVIRFLDPSGSMGDADIAGITKDLKFTEVLDLITYVGKDDLTSARNILTKYDQRFATAAEESITNEYSSVPTTKKPSGFKPIKPVPTIASKPTNPNGSQSPSITPMSRGQGDVGDDDGEDINALLSDPMNKNKPEVRQIQSLLQRMKR